MILKNLITILKEIAASTCDEKKVKAGNNIASWIQTRHKCLSQCLDSPRNAQLHLRWSLLFIEPFRLIQVDQILTHLSRDETFCKILVLGVVFVKPRIEREKNSPWSPVSMCIQTKNNIKITKIDLRYTRLNLNKSGRCVRCTAVTCGRNSFYACNFVILKWKTSG